MLRYLFPYGVLVCIFGILDFIWLGNFGVELYRQVLGDALAKEVRPVPAIIFYLLYTAGVCFFVVFPALAAKDARQALLRGAALGLLCYGTFDLTNHATMAVWSTTLTVTDMAWGTFATGFASWLTVLAAKKLLPV
jgi:uncharacterized membrane protein